MTTALYLYSKLDQAPNLALDAVPFYTQSINCLKNKTARLLHICEGKIQDTIEVVYPILRHPRQSAVHGILSSTKRVANLIGLGALYKKVCYTLSKRASRVASIEYQIL